LLLGEHVLVSKKVMCAATEDAIYLEDIQHHPKKLITCRGIPFWNKHARMCKMDLAKVWGQRSYGN
jgi:hypothetical protein